MEQPAQARDHDTWQALMEQVLVGLNCQVIQVTRDGSLSRDGHTLWTPRQPILRSISLSIRALHGVRRWPNSKRSGRPPPQALGRDTFVQPAPWWF